MFAAHNAFLTAASKSSVTFKSASAVTSTSITIPSHAVGDLIIIQAFRYGFTVAGATPPTAPSASGTVPTWTTLGTQTNSTGLYTSIRIAYTVATATNHTSGTWTNANDLTVMVLSGQKASPFGGWNATVYGDAASITVPSVTQSSTDGTSQLVQTVGAIASGSTATYSFPSGYTSKATGGATDNKMAIATKNVTTSDGSVTVTPSTTLTWWATQIEVLA